MNYGQNWTFITLCKYSVMIGSPLHICINEALDAASQRIEDAICFVFQAKEKYEKSLDELSKCTPQYMENMEVVFEQCQRFEENRLNFLREVPSGYPNAILTSPRAKGQLQITDLLCKTWWSEVQSFKNIIHSETYLISGFWCLLRSSIIC